MAREGFLIVSVTALVAVGAFYQDAILVAVVFLVVSGGLVYLFREPQREIPSLPLALVSPADGQVKAIGPVKDPWLEREAISIQIQTSLLGPYTLRSPTEGKLVKAWYSITNNGHAEVGSGDGRVFWIQTDEQDDVVTVIQATGAALRLRCYVNPGERIGQGARCGFLYFGGMINVLVPPNSRIDVEVGDPVLAGTDVVATLRHN